MNAGSGGSPGILGADLICTDTAGAAGLGGVWRAWLSDTQNNAIDRIVGDGPWIRIDGQPAFPNHAALVAGPLVPLDLDQTGVAVPVHSAVWTGTVPDGTRYADAMPGNGDCLDWTTNSGGFMMTINYGRDGDTDSTDGNWTSIDVYNCVMGARLYCFEQ